MHEVLPTTELDKLASVETTSTEVKPRAVGGSVQTESVEQIVQAISRCDREIGELENYLRLHLNGGLCSWGSSKLTDLNDLGGALLGYLDWHSERDLLLDELERRRRPTRP